jgi:hypothetical protein
VIRRPAAIAAVASAALCLAPPASADQWLLRVGRDFQQLGAWRISDTASVQDAVDAFGPPATCTIVRRPDARVAWAAGFDLLATSLGAPPGTPCSNPAGYQIDHVTVTGRRFTTSLGLRVGDNVSALRRRYPGARFHRGWYEGYWLVTKTARCAIGVCTSKYVVVPKLVARVRGGRVTALVLPVGSQGE